MTGKRMRRCADRLGFTLMEVNLAVFIMAVAVLGMVALYPLGFRESQQSRDDVVEAVLAEGILNPIVATLSSTNLTWSAWQDFLGPLSTGGNLLPANGWKDYCGNERSLTPLGRTAIRGVTERVLGKLPGGTFSSASAARQMLGRCNDLGLSCALVASYGEVSSFGNGSGQNAGLYFDPTRIVLTLRLARRSAQLFGQPAFYTEVHFQGNPNE